MKQLIFIASISGLLLGSLIKPAHGQLPYGSDTCQQGYVWREAFPGDHVCVDLKTRSKAAADNAQAGARRQPGGGAYGPDTCRQGFVWREAGPNDHVCVPPITRAEAASENRQAGNRFARNTPNTALDEKIFAAPRFFDERLDWCMTWGKDCGQPVADSFCRRKRLTGARAFQAEPNIGRSSPTRLMGSNQVCNQDFCTGFQYIACYGPIPSERVFANPVWNGHRLDVCLNWAKDCGKPPADKFCQSKGYSSAFHFVTDPEPGYASTRLIGTNQICSEKFCTGFQMIVCQ
jgi:hypothetical protein